MDYSIKSNIENGLNKLYLENNKTGEFCVIIPEFGASLSEIYLTDGEKLFSVLDGYKTIEEFNENKLFKSALLQPFVNRLEGGKYNLDGLEFTLPINYHDENNACHGFVFDKCFSVDGQSIDNNKCSIKLVYNYFGKMEGYPFDFSTFVTYTLDVTGVSCKTKIVNRSSHKIPFASGWHPYFQLKSRVDDLYLEIPESEIYELNNNKIPTGNSEKYSKFQKLTKIEKSNLDICLGLTYEKAPFQLAETKIVSNLLKVELIVWQEIGTLKYNFLQIYIPPKRDTIAIEPLTSCINSFNNGIGSIIIEPGEEIEIEFGVSLSKHQPI